MSVAKQNALTRQSVDVRRLRLRMSSQASNPAAEIIEEVDLHPVTGHEFSARVPTAFVSDEYLLTGQEEIEGNRACDAAVFVQHHKAGPGINIIAHFFGTAYGGWLSAFRRLSSVFCIAFFIVSLQPAWFTFTRAKTRSIHSPVECSYR